MAIVKPFKGIRPPKDLVEQVESRPYDVLNSEDKDNYLEVTAKHVSKEHALLEVAKYYDLPLEQVMTIGDNFNDSPMLALAGLGIAMGNAPEGVKETANLVTASNDEHGVAQAIMPNARKKKVGKHVPHIKQDLIYPAVLIYDSGASGEIIKK